MATPKPPEDPDKLPMYPLRTAKEWSEAYGLEEARTAEMPKSVMLSEVLFVAYVLRTVKLPEIRGVTEREFGKA